MPTIRDACRLLARSPLFTTTALATLALVIGATTALFAVVNAVLIAPLPYRDPDRLVSAWQADLRRDTPFVEIAYPDFRDWQARARTVEQMAALIPAPVENTLVQRGEALQVNGYAVTAEFFDVLGARPVRGRAFLPGDGLPNAGCVAVIGHGLWQRAFGADEALAGRAVDLGDRPCTVVGIMPPGFGYPRDAELWVPLEPSVPSAALELRGIFYLVVVARLRENVTREEARAELSGIAASLDREYRDGTGRMAAVLAPLRDEVLGRTQPVLMLLFASVLVVLLIACANIAGLLLARATAREREIAVRLALGATRGQIARQLLAESAVLAICGSLAGVLVAHWLLGVIVGLAPANVPRLTDAAIDVGVFGFVVLAAVVTTLGCGLAPALQASRTVATGALQAGRAVLGAAPGTRRLRGALVVAEVALAIVLLVGAGLMGRSLLELARLDLGYEPESVLSVHVAPNESRYPDREATRRFYDRLLERVGRLPDVRAAAGASLRPLWSHVGFDGSFALEGQSEAEAARNPITNVLAVTPGYFDTMGIRLRRGRTFTTRDTERSPGVIVIGERLARAAWPGRDPLGKRMKLSLGADDPFYDTWMEVIGVVEDTRHRELEVARLDLYLAARQTDMPLNYLLARGAGDPSVLAGAIRTQVRALDPDQPVGEILPMTEAVERAMGTARFRAQLIAAFSVVALVLALMGIYGTVSYLVSARTREIGIRTTLGARPVDVLALFLGHAGRLVVLGAVIGLAGALAASRALQALLFEVSPRDPQLYAGVSALMIVAAMLATYVPARRALRVDPAVVLRQE